MGGMAHDAGRPAPAESPEDGAARAYFTELDRASSDQVPRALRQASRGTAPLLQNRLVRRIRHGHLAEADPIPAKDAAVIRAHMDDLLDRHLAGNTTRLARAMERFANGQLRRQAPDGAWKTQPSSGLYFLFGEFALVAYEHHANGRWLECARAMVQTQEVFIAAYGRAPGQRGLLAYKEELYLGPVSEPHLACIRARYAPYGYRELLIQSTMNGISAFPELRQP